MSETVTMTLTEFLLERIAEDEIVIGHGDGGLLLDDAYFSDRRWIAECAAKRRIVAGHPDYGGNGESCATCAEPDSHIDLTPWPCPTLRALGLPYADHPDYREEWKP